MLRTPQQLVIQESNPRIRVTSSHSMHKNDVCMMQVLVDLFL